VSIPFPVSIIAPGCAIQVNYSLGLWLLGATPPPPLSLSPSLLPPGVGEQLPNLDSFHSAEGFSPTQAEPSSPVSCGHNTDDTFTFPTPHRPTRMLCPANFYNGLDSEAGAKLLMSPAITGRNMPINRPLFGESTQVMPLQQ
jgi:hypothetical protein